MIIQIRIDKQDSTAGITFTTPEGLEVMWPDLPDGDQAIVINALAGFTQMFQKAYINAHVPVPEEKSEETVEGETVELEEPKTDD